MGQTLQSENIFCKHGGYRKGNLGHLTKIANYQIWDKFKSEYLEKTNKNNNTDIGQHKILEQSTESKNIDDIKEEIGNNENHQNNNQDFNYDIESFFNNQNNSQIDNNDQQQCENEDIWNFSKQSSNEQNNQYNNYVSNPQQEYDLENQYDDKLTQGLLGNSRMGFILARQVPQNYICLILFTLAMSYMVSCTCSILGSQNNGQNLVLIAAVMTLGVSLALTAYAFYTKTDFTMMGGFIFCFFIVLIIFGFFATFSHQKTIYIIYCALSVILYSIYLIYDTQLIAGGKKYELSVDDYVVGAMMLYIDIIMIFLELLKILQASR
ncbi:hypothetical protein IMG5_167280 [Ichthyophthirius multifiliis]|uniref:Uncharacterized protein n=1 Tax=Ichthyophthirius multifiliis TaxID=5932 RepID=G0R0W4_ICHMU|nr:hypothetical protein IMG5_167280 [Ichthyophthirius multifiliis]EGR28875.1 hypothetical protein IMG5_167280 [Ichthyophthirius multifiliis]|eukprot:XP_004030111.1 hypothetical protein IMG5_167280 [Ichthyophthirius multifiliis]